MNRGPHGAAGPARARALPLTGPADVARRLAAVGAAPDAAFVAAAGQGWVEWPLSGIPGEGLAVPGRIAVGNDRLLLAGAPEQLPALAGRLAPRLPDLAGWLGGNGAYPEVPGSPAAVRCGPHTLQFGVKTYVVAIVNRTSDSFSEERPDLPDVAEVVARARAAYAAGADIVDIGAESSEERDGGTLDAPTEAERLLPVVEALSDLPVILSIDTRRGPVAQAALALRPVVINDVAALADPELAAAAAAADVPVVAMHSGPVPQGQDPMAAIAAFLEAALARAVRAGLAPEQVIFDAGFGFDKDVREDLECTRRLGELRRLGRALLHAPSRKRTIGRVLAYPETIPERLGGTAATVALGIAAGADLCRVHDVAEMARVARMSDALTRGPGWADIVAP